ncbi:MAG: tetratricopeptide repeat protein [Fidelibacterota bacterium]|nr:MAG: tetratricopeptide repeat protein [Candidatus Neomarinimicrobiota bacterium]
MKVLHQVAVFPLVSILLFLVPVQGQESENSEPQYDSRALSYYLDGDLYMMEGDYQEAVAAYQRALTYDSSSATIYLALGEALLRQGQLDGSQSAGEKARQLQPDDPLVYDFLSRNAVTREDADEAIKHLDKWAELDPANLDPLFRKAGLLLRQNKYAEAIDTYLAIYDRDPLQEQVLPRAGEIALSTGDLERAYQAYLRLYRRRPQNERIIQSYAEVSVRTKRFKEAAQAFEQLEKTGKSTLATSLQLAWLHLQLKDLDRAQSLLGPLVEKGHRQWEVLSLSGHVAEQLSDYEHLAEVSTFMKETYPDSVGGYTGLAIARNYLDDKPGAIDVLEEAVHRFPLDPDVRYLLGNLYFGAERYSEAEPQLLAALEHRPSASYIQHLLATTWSNLGKYLPSDSLYEVVLRVNSSDATVMNNYAYSIAERPDVTKSQLRYARKLSRQSLKKQPDNAAFLDTYGWIHFRLGRYRKARKYIIKSLEIRPNHAIVLEHLGDVYRKLGQLDQAEVYYGRAEQAREQASASAARATKE